MEELKEIVSKLIRLKQEGNYWDFKREWHSNKCDLLHDIICMANNQANRDCYIIIGIDEEKDYTFFDLRNSNNRRATKDIVDFLKGQNFAGGIRPTAYVETLNYEVNIVDVIVVKNDSNTPYYLIKDYADSSAKIFAYHIYTRIMDVNTAKDSSADTNKIENLWRKRFRLNESPLEQFKELLKDKDNWIESPVEGLHLDFYKYRPEFTIKYIHSEDRNGYEFYLFSLCDSSPSWYDIQINYFGTVLEDIGGAAFDGARLFSTTPERDGFGYGEYESWEYVYSYFVEKSLLYLMHQYLLKKDENSEEYYAKKRLFEVILVFESDSEKDKFHRFVKNNETIFLNHLKSITESDLPVFPDLPNYNMNSFKEQYKTALALQKLLLEFRKK